MSETPEAILKKHSTPGWPPNWSQCIAAMEEYANLKSGEQWVSVKRKLYGIYSGCMYEGGGMSSTIYSTIEQARSVAIEMVKKEQEQIERMYADDADDLKEYTWKEVRENSWNNSMDVVSIQELTIFPSPPKQVEK